MMIKNLLSGTLFIFGSSIFEKTDEQFINDGDLFVRCAIGGMSVYIIGDCLVTPLK